MNPATERRLLQLATALACAVPLSMGAISVVSGPDVIRGVQAPWPIDLDSHFRYLSGILLGTGLIYLACLPTIERRGEIFCALCFAIVIGGLARLGSAIWMGWPGDGHRFGLVMELIVVPAITLWQMRVARRFRAS